MSFAPTGASWRDEAASATRFSFMSVFPPAMARPDFSPSQEPPGFDRQAYQPTSLADVRDFFLRER